MGQSEGVRVVMKKKLMILNSYVLVNYYDWKREIHKIIKKYLFDC